jgi:predicted enzyme related to lactoylglutathione lyase
MAMNHPNYFEIHTADPKRAIEFYSTVFDWHFTKQEGLPIDYWQIATEGMNGGLLERPVDVQSAEMGTNAYICSMEVADFDVSAQYIAELGGRVALPKFAVPGKCWQGYFLDLEGNTFGLFQVDETAA